MGDAERSPICRTPRCNKHCEINAHNVYSLFKKIRLLSFVNVINEMKIFVEQLDWNEAYDEKSNILLSYCVSEFPAV